MRNLGVAKKGSEWTVTDKDTGHEVYKTSDKKHLDRFLDQQDEKEKAHGGLVVEYTKKPPWTHRGFQAKKK